MTSSASSSSGDPQLGTFDDTSELENVSTDECGICQKALTAEKNSHCPHSVCQSCQGDIQNNPGKVQCPKCDQDCVLPSQRITNFESDDASDDVLKSDGSCTSCKIKDTNAVARCYDCDKVLCGNCVLAHQYMNCFDGHRMAILGMHIDDLDEEVPWCPRHTNEALKLCCKICGMKACKECAEEVHHCYSASEVGTGQSEAFERSRINSDDLNNAAKSIEHLASRVDVQYHKARADIQDTFDFFTYKLKERKTKIMDEIESIFKPKAVELALMNRKIKDMIEKMQQFTSLVDNFSTSQITLLNQIVDANLRSILECHRNVNTSSVDYEFISNFKAIDVAVKNVFGYIRHNFEDEQKNKRPAAIPVLQRPIEIPDGPINSDQSRQDGYKYESNIISSLSGSETSLGSVLSSFSDIGTYEKWSSGSTDTDSVIDLSKSNLSGAYITASGIERAVMKYHCKFGNLGLMDGEFTEPSGVAVNAQDNIIVTDSNGHRVQIFDCEGRFKFLFGKCGRSIGELFYPHGIAVVEASGDIVVIERSPSHQIQIYNQYGQFVRKFGQNVVRFPRAVAVDNKRRIIVVECKVMAVTIFDLLGSVLKRFSCLQSIGFPNSVAVNEREEIFISDNKSHCVKVFNYGGVYLRQIGAKGITSFPIGVSINEKGEVLVADNFMSFHITVFTQGGEFVKALESYVKHAQCFDIAPIRNGCCVLSTKDCHIYIYRYEVF